MNITDLTKSLYTNILVYQEGDYKDPPFKVSTWCDIETQGYAVSKLEMGTQTGTHIDAPRHFALNGETLDKLPLTSLIGAYQLVDIVGNDIHFLETHSCPTFLFLRFHKNSLLSEENLLRLLSEINKVWVVCGVIKTDSRDPFVLHRTLAKMGCYLVEDLDETASFSLKKNGTLFVAPMRLENVSGAPCRVLAIYD